MVKGELYTKTVLSYCIGFLKSFKMYRLLHLGPFLAFPPRRSSPFELRMHADGSTTLLYSATVAIKTAQQ